ncbi:cupin [Novosphingobium rosa]|uniref:cupin n=1 Tax=Novosphingobium rosa TaxID=76978 RepID=UPI000836D025|nr:cupin [Novosphingobium rosa]
MAKCRVFAIDDGLKTVVEGGLYTKHLYGENLSVSVVKFTLPKGPDLPAKTHFHGEEASLQIVGGCEIIEGDGDAGDPVTVMGSRSAVIIPEGLHHYGTNSYGAQQMSLRLNIVSPPRREFGPEDAAPYYPLKEREA